MKIEIEKLSLSEVQSRGIESWPIWTKEVSVFDWYYDSKEMCLILEGKAIIRTDKEEVTIQAGDFVTFPEGLSCVWEIKDPIRKHYKFE